MICVCYTADLVAVVSRSVSDQVRASLELGFVAGDKAEAFAESVDEGLDVCRVRRSEMNTAWCLCKEKRNKAGYVGKGLSGFRNFGLFLECFP